MKPVKILAAAIIITAVSCNSGTTTASSTDSSAVAADTTKMAADTSHMAMDMSAGQALPAIPAGAKVFFKNLKDGAKLTSPFKVEMGASGIRIDSAGTVKDSSGHFHLLIDAEDSIPSGTVVKKDSTHLHYGKAQTSAELTLTPGKHKIALQFADGIHRSYGAKLSAVVTVEVKK